MGYAYSYFCVICQSHHTDPMVYISIDEVEVDDDWYDWVPKCAKCGAEHYTLNHEIATAPKAPSQPSSRRIDALKAMARQNESPYERDIARDKLKAMGIPI